MDPEKLFDMQRQMRRNNEDVNDFLTDLDSWESDIKQKDDALKKRHGDKQDLPPIRNSLEQKRKKKKKKAPKETKVEEKVTEKKKKINSYDYRAWDKFDVDKACEQIDDTKNSSPDEYETDEEWEAERKQLLAVQFKDQGNQLFKEAKYIEAIEQYTKAIDHDQSNAVFAANRAMALIKQEKYAAAELDCTMAISLDASYLKAYHRRGTARAALNKYQEAKLDFEKVLKQDPKNKQARQELDKIERLLNPPKVLETKSIESCDIGMVKAVYKPAARRSKKPLRRIQIEEIGEDEEVAKRKQQMSSAQSKQSQTKQRITAKDNAQFDLLLSNENASNTNKNQFNSENTVNRDMANLTPGDILTQTASVTEKLKRIQMVDDDSGAITQNGDSEKVENSVKLDNKSDVKRENVTAKGDDGVSSQTSSPATSPRVPAAPSTSYQFQADYTVLKNHNQQFYQYFKQIKPSLLPKLFGPSLDADVLVTIFQTLHDHYLPTGDDVYEPLRYLCDVSRFTMTVMFMSSNEKKVLQALFEHLSSTTTHSKEDIQKLKVKYKL